MSERINRAVVEHLFGTLPDSHYAAIGRVAATSAALEVLISSAIWQFGKMLDEPGACVTSQIYTIDGKLKAFIAILRWQNVSNRMIKKLNKFYEDLRKPIERRNLVIPDPLVGEFETEGQPATKLCLQITAKKSLVLDHKKILTKDVDSLANLIWDKIA